MEDNINPIFYNTVDVVFYALDLETAPPIIMEIYDYDDAALDTDDYIGKSVITLTDAHVNHEDAVPTPKWHPIKYGYGKAEPTMGELLVSFSIVAQDFKFRATPEYMRIAPITDEYLVEINILGLRGLQSVGILPVKKAFIKFNLKSLLPPDAAGAMENIKTQPSAKGPDPSISCTIKFDMWLPNDPLYCPSLSCAVYDYIFKGLSQPILGNFIIPIGDLLQ